MVYERDKMICYVSDLGTGMVYIIDWHNYKVIKEVKIGLRPQNIIVDENNNLYIASDKNSKVTFIHDLYKCDKAWQMTNNGNIQVDFNSGRIYVCDTDEICIYSLETGEKVGCIAGFIAADGLELDKYNKRLFVLDVLQNEIKVYDTSDFSLIKSYENIGSSSNYFLLGEDKKYIYIANKGRNEKNITILQLDNGEISQIDLEEGSIIVDLKQNENILYAANSGLNRIEVIDILKKKCLETIKTTLSKPQKLELSPNKKVLFATSRNNYGKGAIDRIDTLNSTILDNFIFKGNNSSLGDIKIVVPRVYEIQEESVILAGSKNKLNEEFGTTIIAKKVLSSYEEKKTFSNVSIKLSNETEGLIKIEEIIFRNCEIIDETKDRQILETRKEYSILKYNFYIPYCIWYKDEQEKEYTIEGTIEGVEKATLYIPLYAEQQKLEFTISSFTKVKNTPVLIGKTLQFDVTALISTKVIVDETVFIPTYKKYAP